MNAEIGVTVVVGVDEDDVWLRREERRAEGEEENQKAHGFPETKPLAGHSGKECVGSGNSLFTASGHLFYDLAAMTAKTASSAATKPNAEYAIYKPNGRGNGGVIRFEFNRTKGAVFVDATNQSGEKQFDWESKITMKWGLNDLGSVLATLQGRQEQAKLFHQSEKANSAFELTYRDDPQKAPFFMSMSRQEGATKTVKKVTIPVTHAEAAILETGLRAAITRLIGW
jgi:hypothetical protein